jgi:hypothetical protein
VLASACREAFVGFGSGVHARAAADQLFGALVERHTSPMLTPKYEYGRLAISRSALSPSRVFDDTATWTALVGQTRLAESQGSFTDGRYLLAGRHNPPAPARPADAQHSVVLTHLADGEYRWDASVDFALGTIRPTEIAAVVSRLIASSEGRTERDLRAELAAGVPRTSAVLSTLFSLDSIHPTVLADGSTAVTVGIGLHVDQLRPRFPAFADYVRKYVESARFHFLLSDRTNIPFLEITGRDRLFTIRLRTQNGHMVPLAGPARPMPDTLQLDADFKVKVKIFNVGFHDLHLDFVNGATDDRERYWSVVAHHEPQWNLPFITARLLRAPLRRPFSGEGSMFRIGVRAGEGGAPTLLMRQTRLFVQESAILNFLNSLSSTAMDEFSGAVEREEGEWLRELFAAMRADAQGVLAGS